MKSEIEKYIWYYLSVYIIILIIFGFFQFISICNAQSLNCKLDGENIFNILTVTAYVLTPIIAIIGFISWKVQFNKQLTTNYFIEVITAMRDLHQNLDPIYREIIVLASKLEIYSDVLGFKNSIPNKLNTIEIQSKLEKELEDTRLTNFFDIDFNTLRKKVNYIETLLTEMFTEEHFFKNNLLDFPNHTLMIINIIEKIVKEKNAKNFKKIYSLLNKNNEYTLLSKQSKKGLLLISIDKKISEDIISIQYEYINLILELKKKMSV
ncbi:MAG: hypothetical protein H9855_08575 [Candidatus Acinetobacter avistercoris]|uniref:hypothetical protein n=1 Tax=Acinetobacter sp. KS-LM10 TaxID=3120518 RepID=UPI001F9A678F|nr:hypothetical protein [Candidatus Acinetobacter avistercoris]